jgi:hypothetical protein
MTSADKKIIWIAGAILLVLTIASVLTAPSAEQESSPVPSSYRSTPSGARAAYLLLEALGERVERLEEPPLHLRGVAPHTTLIIADPTIMPSRAERRGLRQFVTDGGRVLFCGSKLRDFFPGLQLTSFEAGPQHRNVGVQVIGAGEIVWWASAAPLTNIELQKDGNLALFLNSIDLRTRQVVYWDEYFHGERGSLWDYVTGVPAIRCSALPLALLVIAAMITFSRRRGPLIAPARVSRLSPLEFVDSLGNLYQKAKAAPLVVEITARELRLQLIRKLALPAEISDAALAREAAARLGWNEQETGNVLSRAGEAAAARSLPVTPALELVQAVQRLNAMLSTPIRGHPV